MGLIVGAFFQLRSLSTGMILGLGINKTIWIGWIVQVGGLRDDQPFDECVLNIVGNLVDVSQRGCHSNTRLC